jgi:hypothetical protein
MHGYRSLVQFRDDVERDRDARRAVEVGIRLLDHAARINGYAAPQKHEVSGKDGKPLSLIPIELARRVLEEVDNEK